MDWHRSYNRKPGYTKIIGPSPGGLKYIEMGVLCLEPQQTFASHSGSSEVALVVMSGLCAVVAGGREFARVGGRTGFFQGTPAAIYLPPNTEYSVTGLTDVEIAVGQTTVSEGGEPIYVDPDTIACKVLGEGPMERNVRFVMHDAVPAARLIVGETVHVSGGWSGWPPHKHDVDDPPRELASEEVYLIQIDPPQGFGFLRIYDGDKLDVTCTVRDHDVVAIPRGYHPLVGAPGYSVGFLWFMAGATRKWAPSIDPHHAWTA